MRVLIIGYGNMGQTYASSFISSGFVSPSDILVLNKREVEKKKRFSIDKLNFYTESVQPAYRFSCKTTRFFIFS